MSDEMSKSRSSRKRRRSKRRADGEINRGTYILPNLFTTANLFSGFYGIVSTISGNYQAAAIAILVSCLFDILDGKVARYANATSRFGVEYDSLADLVAFGVGPALLLYLWALKPFGRVGWLAAFVFVACGALRLARFNVQVNSVSKKYFVGLPIPGAACMVATTVLFFCEWKGPHFSGSSAILLGVTYLLGFLMVSNIRYNSMKELEVVKGKPLPALFVVVVLLSVVAAKPRIMLFSLLVAYVISGPLSLAAHRIRSWKQADKEAPVPRESTPKEDTGVR
ncbi:CDP-diacylglycerol--serine O-phosphatidyltransferase [Desulfoglaeba alkanexedens]|uniref:CDP-diacylglycerol--serine O-phosphatidyltransferase n=1 Tax=Desulfoglaeba alkanexedens ALDC TaxID=980445 RepID=A0A4P8L0C7_9BACT|nr:CDP-diacylglycerol--serine O-phosphatidyltransferase [Desulfoglaeba alkanexedens]QCQ21228.1 CDP-diacylglycerol--serine O-phosphatidyltransferase [Desulfoglaeba alkanexedens ALDC]